MPVTQDKPAPYAPATAILALVERHRSKGLPTPVNADVLGRAQVSSSLIPRTLQALETLDLIDAEGKPTPVLEGIRLAPEAEYQKRLAEWLTAAYADALAYVDPATDDETSVRDAFRSYTPVGQQPRMVTLFTGLFKAAGIGPEQGKASRPRKTRSVSRPPKAQPPAGNSEDGGAKPQVGVRGAGVSPAENAGRTGAGPDPQPRSPEQVLLDMLDPGTMEKAEQDAVWTLLLYLKTLGARTASKKE